jgi:hypothetical protein
MHMRSTVDKSVTQISESTRLTIEGNKKLYMLVYSLTEDGVGRVQGGLVHRRLADEPLGVGERHARRREAVALLVGDDLAAVVLPNIATHE